MVGVCRTFAPQLQLTPDQLHHFMPALYLPDILNEKYVSQSSIPVKPVKSLGGLYITDKTSGRIKKVIDRKTQFDSRKQDYAIFNPGLQ